jgi:hypothetical protein
MPTQNTINGELSIRDLANTLMYAENMGFLGVASVKAASSGVQNIATFEESNEQLGELLLEEVDGNQNIPSLIAARLADGKRFLFESEIYVASKKARVAFFRAKRPPQ